MKKMMATRPLPRAAWCIAAFVLSWNVGCGSSAPNPGGSSGSSARSGTGNGGGTGGTGMNAGDASMGSGASGGAGGSSGAGSGTGTNGGSGTAIDTDASVTGADGGGPGAWEGGTNYMAAAPPDFGPNVLIFDPSMPMPMIQSSIDAIFTQQFHSQFGTGRYTFFFKPGNYTLDIQVGYYMQVVGLGQSPNDVVITGAVRSKDSGGGGATLNFWRSVENLTIVPVSTIDASVDVWAVSQGASFRRVHVKGALSLADQGFSSGGFLGDSQIDTRVSSGSQQQWFSRNTQWATWVGGNWNMVFLGTLTNPTGTWPASPYTVVAMTPIVRQKPFMSIDTAGKYSVMVPAIDKASQGPSWLGTTSVATPVPIGTFYIAHQGTDTAATINAALGKGANLIFTPGIYHLENTLQVGRPGTIIVGLGLPTLVPDTAAPAMVISDVDGVKVGGIIFDAGATGAPTLLQVGAAGSSADHSADPTFLQDLYCRVGGGSAGTASSCMTIDSNDVVGDNFWLWRADHGAGVGWTQNIAKNGLIVNGNGVTIYGLAVEHFQEYQTYWNGNGGRVYFYQSEFPYDPTTQSAWQNGTVNGYASYKVADAVTTHEAWGLGVYCAFRTAVVVDNGFEAPTAPGVLLHHTMTRWLNGTPTSVINHVMNGTGTAATQANRMATLN
jgi:hypothetical protein